MDNMYGYVRVSSIEQNEDRQMIALKKAGTGDCCCKKARRPFWQAGI